MSIEFHSIRLGGLARGIVIKTVHKTLSESLVVCVKLVLVQEFTIKISFKFTGAVVFYLLFMHPLAILVSISANVQDFESKSGE